MKFLKPILVSLILIALTYTVSANKISFNKFSSQPLKVDSKQRASTNLPINGDLLFAFTAIASLGGYITLKK